VADATRAGSPLTRALAGRPVFITMSPAYYSRARRYKNGARRRTASAKMVLRKRPEFPCQSFTHVLLRNCAIAKLIASGSAYFVLRAFTGTARVRSLSPNPRLRELRVVRLLCELDPFANPDPSRPPQPPKK